MKVEPVKPWSPPSGVSITIERLIGIATIAQGGLLLLRHRRKALLPWIVSVVSWFSLCKYVICTHCEHHGKFCEFYGLGTLASKMFPKQRKRSLSPFGWATEGISMGGMLLLPFSALGKSSLGTLLFYTASIAATYLATFTVSCRRCALTATDQWKSLCPNYHIASRIWK